MSRNDEEAHTASPTRDKRSRKKLTRYDPAVEESKSSAGQVLNYEWSEKETENFYRVKHLLPNIHHRLRIGASKNVGVGRVRLQCKHAGTISTIKTFGVEEIDAIFDEARAWAAANPESDSEQGSVRRPKRPRETWTPNEEPQIEEHDEAATERAKRVKVFCERLSEFLIRELSEVL
eukprot:c40958_g1_i1.p1 GENE.c40958_g1_i1~~c40958_g1_i1.p1  ORF type:complete len:177 (-),score=36.15 c40958_g1_i1:133-663(-)